MAILRRIFWFMRPSRKARRADYGNEVLYAGWVDTKTIPTQRTPRR